MMGERTVLQEALFYNFSLEQYVPADHLLRSIYPVQVYSPYEKRIIKDLAHRSPDLGQGMTDLRSRLRDLLPVVRESIYFPKFHFSNSIKYVGPALCPGFTYDGIGAIKDGMAAADTFMKISSLTVADDGLVSACRRDLLAYCKNDTLAMVEVHKALLRLSGNDFLGRSESR